MFDLQFKKSKYGDMTLFGLIIALSLLLIFSPIFSYVHSRQSINVSTETIKTSLKSYSENVFNELFDEAKATHSTNHVFSSLVNNNDLKKDLPKKIMAFSNFSLSESDDENKIYTSKNGVIVKNPILFVEKTDEMYCFKLLYDLEMPLNILGINIYNYSDTYVAVCNIQRDLIDFNTNNIDNSEYELNYKYKVLLGKDNPEDVIGYLVVDGSLNKTLYINGKGQMADEGNFTVILEDKSIMYTDTFPWKTEVLFNNSFTGELDILKDVDRVIVSGRVTNIPNNCFENSSISDIDFGTSIKSIGDNAFYNCSNLSKSRLIIPSSVESIGRLSFSGCNLSSVELKEGIKHLGENAFEANNLTSINLPASILKIDSYCFANNPALTNVSSANFARNVKNSFIGEEHFVYSLVEYIKCADGVLPLDNIK